MEFTEIEGERKGSKVLVTEDKHLYRYAKPNTPYLICYPPGQPRITHDKVMTKVCRNLSELVELCRDSSYWLLMTFMIKFVVVTINFLLYNKE